ncbi:MAG: AAA family ATPase, partial [Planctomycetales bacterium]|nr:AAA family ATPase [Planctomycetales bacterium]
MNTQNDDILAVEEISDAYRAIREQIGRVIVGQESVVDQILIALFANGHCMLVGVPGLAKTLLVSTVAQCLSLQ